MPGIKITGHSMATMDTFAFWHALFVNHYDFRPPCLLSSSWHKVAAGANPVALKRGIDKAVDLDEQIGVTIVKRALEEPLCQIVQNAGKEGAVIVERVRSERNASFDYNAATDTFEDLINAGIIDPAKATRCALQNAASIVGLMLTTEVFISEFEEDDKQGRMSGGMGGGMGTRAFG